MPDNQKGLDWLYRREEEQLEHTRVMPPVVDPPTRPQPATGTRPTRDRQRSGTSPLVEPTRERQRG